MAADAEQTIIPPPARSDELDDADENNHTYMEDGVRWTVAATDGSLLDGTHPKLARGGLGVFYSKNSPRNAKDKLRGPTQTSARAEVAALRQLVATAEMNVHVLIDCEEVARGFEDILMGKPLRYRADQDLWNHIKRGIEAKGPGTFRVEKVPAHTKTDAIDRGETTVVAHYLNAEVDELAKAGARLHTLPDHVRDAARRRVRRAVELQLMAAKILEARANARPLPHRSAGYTDAQLAALDPKWTTPRAAAAPIVAAAAPAPAGPAAAAIIDTDWWDEAHPLDIPPEAAEDDPWGGPEWT